MSEHQGMDTPCFKTKRIAGGIHRGGPLESCREGGSLRWKVGESVSTEAEAPCRGRKLLP